MATMISGAFALISAAWYMSDDLGDPVVLVLTIAAASGAMIAAGGLWRIMVPQKGNFSIPLTVVAGIAAVPLAHIIMWTLTILAARLWDLSEGQGAMSDLIAEMSLGSSSIYFAFYSTMFTAPVTLPLSIGGLLGVTIWCRRRQASVANMATGSM